VYYDKYVDVWFIYDKYVYDECVDARFTYDKYVDAYEA
jgi:hypothetical protein